MDSFFFFDELQEYGEDRVMEALFVVDILKVLTHLHLGDLHHFFGVIDLLLDLSHFPFENVFV